MFEGWFRKNSVDVGWHIDPDRARIIWFPPEKIELNDLPSNAKELKWTFEASQNSLSRYYLIRCPVDLNFKLVLNQGKVGFQSLAGNNWGISMQSLRQLIHVSAPYQWRHPKRPLVQFATPYRFISDDLVYITQLPAFFDYDYFNLPGVLISGRFPIDVWPRIFMWAIEWHDLDKPLVMKRGDPWFVMMFEPEYPEQIINLFEAERTPELVEYITQVDGVTSYVNQTFSLFKTGWSRRPKKLLQRKIY